jgi:hypothetical protein
LLRRLPNKHDNHYNDDHYNLRPSPVCRGRVYVSVA